MSIAENLAQVRERMASACRRAGRSESEVTLVGVSKGFPAEAAAAACAAGLEDLGENRVQEAVEKVESLEVMGARPRWHLVGHLQTNKAKTAANLFAIIHSVDSLRLAQALSRRAHEPVPILLEVNVAQEASKYGFTATDVAAALPEISALPNLEVRGLMTIAPMADDPEIVRPVFQELRQLCSSLGLHELSMGMTDDFEVAIEEGSTMVRIGRAIFGERRQE